TGSMSGLVLLKSTTSSLVLLVFSCRWFESHHLTKSLIRFLYSSYYYLIRVQKTLGGADALNVMKFLHILPLRKITFRQVIISAEFLIVLLPFLAQSNIKELAFIQSRLIFSSQSIILPHTPFKIKSASLENVMVPSSFLAPDLLTLHEWLMKPLTKVLLTKTQISHLEFGIEMLNLTYLDLSENKLQDTALTVSLCAEGYPELMVLKLRKNYLRSYATVCQTLRLFSKLIHLDLSQHDFSDPPPFQCLWQQSFKVFNISNANLQNTEKYLPEKVEILDLSKNRLSTFDVYLPRLKELYISNNKLMTLPLAHNFPGLEVFNIEVVIAKAILTGNCKRVNTNGISGSPFVSNVMCGICTTLPFLSPVKK
uniref:Monocyte differentiation antigen CD14 n=1 Tax=Erpetoichthys calabaricus TaxID=27687 RepID=A0A8C4STC5_ERPCA